MNGIHMKTSNCIIGDKACPLLLWLMASHKQTIVSMYFIFETSFNKQFNHPKVIVENKFGIINKFIF
jgi:hypothetical protein